MNSEQQVKDLITTLKTQGVPLSQVAWQAACACVGWPYVYGATGEECRPAKRAQYANKFYLKDHKTIVTKCKALTWDTETQTAKINGSCNGCQWNLPVLMFDCRGFTRKILQMVYGWTLMGATVGSQWSDENNWKDKGTIDTIPKDTLVCLFVYKSNKWQHTGFGYNDQTVEASSGVEYSIVRKAKWTHWAVPKCEEDYQPEPIPEGYAIVTGIRVALRKDASTKADIITRVEKGSRVKLETAPKDWDYVSFSGKTGWMMRAYLREESDYAIVTGRRVAMRQDPCTKAKVIMRINTGSKVNLEPEPPSEWDYVSYDGKTGWMMSKYIEKG